MMSPRVRDVALIAHVTASVGWLGSVAAFLVLSIAALTARDGMMLSTGYIGMNLLGQWLIVPLSLAALVTGIIQGLGTRWGLFRYYWVIAKLALTIVATALLMLHQFMAVAEAARRVLAQDTGPALEAIGRQLLFDAAAALGVLLVITVLSIAKPWGPVGTGRKAPEAAATGMPLGVRVSLGVVAALIATILVVHLAGGGMGRH